MATETEIPTPRVYKDFYSSQISPKLSRTFSCLERSQQKVEARLSPMSSGGPLHSHKNQPGCFLLPGSRGGARTEAGWSRGKAWCWRVSVNSNFYTQHPLCPQQGVNIVFCFFFQLIGWDGLPMCIIPGRKLIKPLDTLPPGQHLFV